MNKNLTVVAIYSTIFEADLAKARLEGEGIRAFVANSNIIGMNWLYSNAVGGVRLEVETHNVTNAKEILSLIKLHEFEIESAETDWGNCPECGSNRIEFVQDNRGTALTWLLFGLPLLFPSEKYKCNNCFHTWKDNSY